MFKTLHLLILLILTFCIKTTFAQQAKPLLPGSTKGILRDTAHNYTLKSATVSVYKSADSSLLSYQISNNYGEFNFKNLPVGISLQLEVSHVSYQTLRKKFTIPTDKNFIDLQTLIVSPKDITLNEVTVSVPPITMNGDTLEFNAAAFKLDSNAVVEDLLRKIPNITLWGDGQITVNGREVKSVLVNGKPFFGGDAKVATQNIAKNALDKVQVYNTVKDKSNPLDSTLTMNLKLKKGKELGYFGKISAGYGTDNRFEFDGIFNVFSPKMQFSVVGAGNNLNKSLNNINTLMNNSTYKGIGTNIDYQSDFRADGINRFNAAGASFTYNFIENPKWDLKNTLSANYFIQNRNGESISELETTTSINTNDKIYEQSRNRNTSENTNQNFDSKYEFAKRNKSLSLTQNFQRNIGENRSENFRSARNAEGILTSTNNSLNQGSFENASFNFQGVYRLSQDWLKPKNKFKGINITFGTKIDDSQNENANVTEFKSFVNAAPDQRFDRKYDRQIKTFNQQLDIELPNLKSFLFGNKRLAGIDFALVNQFNFNNRKEDNEVADLNVNTNNYERNDYLTNELEINRIDETPGISFNKMIHKSLSNRYSNNLNFGFNPKQKIIIQDINSIRSFQNIKRTYSKFLPDAFINYDNYQFGEYIRNFRIGYNTKIRIPNIDLLAPLIDSTNLYSIRRGNINLKEAVDRELTLSVYHSDQTNKNTLNYNFYMAAGLTNNNIVDSVFIDDLNRRTIFATNANGRRYLNFNGNIRKAYKFKTSELQISLTGNVNSDKNPGYTNNLFAFSKNLNTNSNLKLNYTYKSYLAIEVGQIYGTYRSKQEAFDTEYSGVNRASTLSSSVNFSKRLTLSSNIAYNKSTSSNADDINFTIWNANLLYRFLKGNNAEIKLAALDILRQNTSVINYGGNNSFTIGTRNVLQQYFMATLSYYPKQFGKKAAKK